MSIWAFFPLIHFMITTEKLEISLKKVIWNKSLSNWFFIHWRKIPRNNIQTCFYSFSKDDISIQWINQTHCVPLLTICIEFFSEFVINAFYNQTNWMQIVYWIRRFHVQIVGHQTITQVRFHFVACVACVSVYAYVAWSKCVNLFAYFRSIKTMLRDLVNRCCIQVSTALLQTIRHSCNHMHAVMRNNFFHHITKYLHAKALLLHLNLFAIESFKTDDNIPLKVRNSHLIRKWIKQIFGKWKNNLWLFWLLVDTNVFDLAPSLKTL